MALDTLEDIVTSVLDESSLTEYPMAERWVKHVFREVAESRQWSWLMGYGQIVIPAAYDTGTVDLTQGSATVSGTTTVWTAAMKGRQFRSGNLDNLYTVVDVRSNTELILDLPWGGEDVTTGSYSIFMAYYTPPDDFHMFWSVVDTEQSRQLHHSIEQSELDWYDPRRNREGGRPRLLSMRDYTRDYRGIVGDVVQVFGTDGVPTSSGEYTGVDEATFILEVTTTGTNGTAVYRWKKGASGTWVSGVSTASAGTELQQGVWVSWADSITFTDGDFHVITVRPISKPGLPRYEIYPHQTSTRVLPYRYVRRANDLDDADGFLPRYIRGDVLLKGALSRAARWPGTEDRANPFAQVNRSESFKKDFIVDLDILQVQDNQVMQQDVWYQNVSQMPFVNLPWTLEDFRTSDPYYP